MYVERFPSPQQVRKYLITVTPIQSANNLCFSCFGAGAVLRARARMRAPSYTPRMNPDPSFDEVEALFHATLAHAEEAIRKHFPEVQDVRVNFSSLMAQKMFRLNYTKNGEAMGTPVYMEGEPGYCDWSKPLMFSAVYLNMDELTGQMFFEFVLLGACCGLWPVLGIVDPAGIIDRNWNDVDALALWASLGSANLRSRWPERDTWLAAGWHRAQARQLQQTNALLWELDDPEYLR